VSLSRSERTTQSRTFDQRTRIRVNPGEDIKVHEKKENYVGRFCSIREQISKCMEWAWHDRFRLSQYPVMEIMDTEIYLLYLSYLDLIGFPGKP
jgi:hypothetical protein